MKEVGAFEAKNTLSALLDQVERGEEIIITRHGREVAAWCLQKGLSIVRWRVRQPNVYVR